MTSNYEYWSRSRRQGLLKTAFKKKVDTHAMVFPDGNRRVLPVHKVNIASIFYRLTNNRTGDVQLDYLAKHKNLSKDFFESESPESLQVQHELLKTMTMASDGIPIYNALKNERYQTQPLLITHRGEVINGNRRLCCMHELNAEFKAEDGTTPFSDVEVAVLPETIQEKTINLIEGKFQNQPDTRLEYTWQSQALQLVSLQSQGVTMKEINTHLGYSSKEVNALLQQLHEANLYLESRGMQGEYSKLDGDKYSFTEIVKSSKDKKAQASQTECKKRAFQMLAHQLIDVPRSERVKRHYHTIGSLGKYAFDAAIEEIEENYDITVFDVKGGRTQIDDQLGIDDANDEENAVLSKEFLNYFAKPLFKESQEFEGSKLDQLYELLVDVVQQEGDLLKDIDDKKFVIKRMSQAQSLLRKVLDNIDGKRETKGVGAQCSSCEAILKKIRKKIK